MSRNGGVAGGDVWHPPTNTVAPSSWQYPSHYSASGAYHGSYGGYNFEEAGRRLTDIEKWTEQRFHQRVAFLKRFPAFNQKWPEAVQVAWLESYTKILSELNAQEEIK